MKALLLQTLRINGKRFVPSETESVVVDVPSRDFESLVARGVIRELTRDEARLASLDSDYEAEVDRAAAEKAAADKAAAEKAAAEKAAADKAAVEKAEAEKAAADKAAAEKAEADRAAAEKAKATKATKAAEKAAAKADEEL